MTSEEEMDFIPETGKLVWMIPEKNSKLRTKTLPTKVEPRKFNEINFDSADFD